MTTHLSANTHSRGDESKAKTASLWLTALYTFLVLLIVFIIINGIEHWFVPYENQSAGFSAIIAAPFYAIWKGIYEGSRGIFGAVSRGSTYVLDKTSTSLSV